jgi:hypothetical protein
VIKAEQDLPGTRKGYGGKGWGMGAGGRNDPMCAHMNKIIIKKIITSTP